MAALETLQGAKGVHADLLELALRGGKQGSETSINTMDNLVAELKAARAVGDSTKGWCEDEFDKAETHS